jgi:hypothetical protein
MEQVLLVVRISGPAAPRAFNRPYGANAMAWMQGMRVPGGESEVGARDLPAPLGSGP